MADAGVNFDLMDVPALINYLCGLNLKNDKTDKKWAKISPTDLAGALSIDIGHGRTVQQALEADVGTRNRSQVKSLYYAMQAKNPHFKEDFFEKMQVFSADTAAAQRIAQLEARNKQLEDALQKLLGDAEKVKKDVFP